MGVDSALLQQRADFLRQDSALVVVLVTDEDDCSVRESSDYFYALQAVAQSAAFHLPPPRTACATNPDDPCCASCGQAAPAGCPPDPACSKAALDASLDPLNLRC